MVIVSAIMVNTMNLMIYLPTIIKDLDTIEEEADITEIMMMTVKDQEVIIDQVMSTVTAPDITEKITISYIATLSALLAEKLIICIEVLPGEMTNTEDQHGEMKITEDHLLGEITNVDTEMTIMATDTKTAKASNAGEETKMINKSTLTKITITLKTAMTNSIKTMKVTRSITKQEERQEKD
jgi:hypothetical protein